MGGALGCLRPSQSQNAVQPIDAHEGSQHILVEDNNNSSGISPPTSPTPLNAASETQIKLLSDTDLTANHSASRSALSASSSPYPPGSHSSSPHPFSATAPLPASLPTIPSVLQRHLMKQAQVRLIKDVKRTMFAQCLDSDELRAFAALFQLVEVAPGELIFQQGGPADCFYLIRKGAVNIKYSDKESAMLADASSAVSPLPQFATVDADGMSRRTILHNTLEISSPGQQPRLLSVGKVAANKRRANSMQIDSIVDTGSRSTFRNLLGVTNPAATLQPPSPRSAHLPTTVIEDKSSKGAPLATPANANHSRFFSYHSALHKDKQPQPQAASPKHQPSSSLTGVTAPAEPDNLHLTRSSSPSASSFALLTTKGVGEFFGLEALRFGRHVRTCACIAQTQCALLSLSSSAFHNFVSSIDQEDKRKKLYDLVGDSVQTCLQKMPYLSGVSAAKLSLLASLFVWTLLPANKVLFEEGERDKKGNGLYFLYEGTVGVSCKDETGQSKLLKELNAGVCFGELGLIIHLPRTATITAHTDCLLLHLPHRSFHNFLHLTPEILTKFKEQIETYQLNVVYLLDNELISQYFFQHCAREYSTENLEFWWEAKAYRLKEVDKEERKREAERIIQLYITDSSPKQINLKGNTQKNILAAQRKPTSTTRATSPSPSASSPSSPSHNHPPITPRGVGSGSGVGSGAVVVAMDESLFLEAENEIFNLLATDSFSRFKSSPLFRECLEEMHKRVRSSSISVKAGRPGAVGEEDDGGDGEGGSVSGSPDGSLLMADTPEESPKSGQQTTIMVEGEEKQSEPPTPSLALSRMRTVIGSSSPMKVSPKTRQRRHNTNSLKRSKTGVGGAGGLQLSPRQPAMAAGNSSSNNALRRTATLSRLTAKGPAIEHILNAQRREKEARDGTTPDDGLSPRSKLSPKGAAGERLSPRQQDRQQRKSAVAEEEKERTPAAVDSDERDTVVKQTLPLLSVPSLSVTRDSTIVKSSAEADSSFRTFLSSRKKASSGSNALPSSLMLPLGDLTSVAAVSSSPFADTVSSLGPFSPSARAAAAVAAKKRALHAQLIAKRLSSSITPSPSSSPKSSIITTLTGTSDTPPVTKSRALQLTKSASFRSARTMIHGVPTTGIRTVDAQG